MDILLIQMLRLGDALQLVPIIKGIKQCFPDSRLCVLTSELGALALEDQREVDRIFILHKELISEPLMTNKKESVLSAVDQLEKDLSDVSEVKWDWVINFSYTFSSALLSFILDAKHRSGFSANQNRQYLSKEKWFAYSLASFLHRRYSNFNWVDINKNILRLPSVPRSSLITPKHEDVSRVSALLQKAGFKNKKIVGMHPGASLDYKRWPVENFGDLGRALVNKYGYRVVIFGGESEKELGAQLKSYIGDGAENLAGQTTLDELKAFFSLCDLLVTNDTGPMHLASAVGTRIISLFFNTHFVETGPYGTGHVAVHPDISCFPCQGTAKCPHKKCLDYISPETIETIIVSGKTFEGNRGTDFLGKDKGMVRVYFSAFDPWGNLEWVPFDRSPITFEDIERILLKTTWLSYSNVIEGFDNAEAEYMIKAISNYRAPVNKGDLCERLNEFTRRLLKLKDLLEAAYRVSFDIQSELLKSNSDPLVIKHLGGELTEIENEISSFDKDSSISFLSDLLTEFRMNIEQTDILTLCTKTAGVYRDMIMISDGMIQRAKKMSEIL